MLNETAKIDDVIRAISAGRVTEASIEPLLQALAAKGLLSSPRDRPSILTVKPLNEAAVVAEDVTIGVEAADMNFDHSDVNLASDVLEGSVADAWAHEHSAAIARVDKSIILKSNEEEGALGRERGGAKFEHIRELARGGVGCIDIVKDRELMRTLVTKTLIDGTQATEYILKKFVEEAQITAQLEHPNIVPVHEFGRYENGELFFTMKLVQGRTLKDILRTLRKNDPETQAEFGRTRLIGVFNNVCQAIAFAHSRNVIHRDIKPANIMVGEYGEVLLLDWGVAKVLGPEHQESIDELRSVVQTERSTSGDSTMIGLITGTPSYMPPEQAAGRIDRLDARSDVYALGALLYELLTLKPPFHKKTHRETLRAVITEPLIPPSERAPGQNIPTALEEICLKCLRKRPNERFSSVSDVIDGLMKYLAGAEDLDRRVRSSDARLEQGHEEIAKYHRIRAETMECRDRLLELEWNVPAYSSEEDKKTLWACQTEFAETEARMNQAFEAAVKMTVEAVGFNPNNDEACNELARLYWYVLRDAEHAGDGPAVERYRALVGAYDRGLFTEQLKGDGRINLRSQPSDALVTAAQYEEIDRQQFVGASHELGRTSLTAHTLSEGAWMLTLKAAGYREIKLPIHIGRAEVTDINCNFYTDEQIGQHFLQIPAGRFIAGGDPTCASARLRRIENLDDYFIARYPVTCAEYLAFIRDLDRAQPELAIKRVPRTRSDGGQLWDRVDGRFAWPEVDRQGFHWVAHWPVFGISFDDAAAYAAWYTRRTSVAVRLPTELEWEKAARGTDGRWYPWGEHFDATFCRMARTEKGIPLPTRVGSYRSDCSPYGVFDMAGLVREYCDSAFDADNALRVVRGGSYLTAADTSCRLTYRQAALRDVPDLDHGFRLIRVLPDETAKRARRLVRPKL
jgi:serine/threonine protein kinase/formylglycine-generating enzyme required for sulfatase activity